ncbi:unnamed protein product [Onchocerca flexuosa]|uniref:RNA-directed DNA polymerase, eukaryota, reverse transcriptase zinc-binding domain protein n=1 Tax=Onchocerca flexuosa TaxID=387005 RepID=A0A183HHY6_9BILA|nr:unnamed protein product [Onchocerca flexuosa]
MALKVANFNFTMDIIVPQRRSVANSWQILISHLFGDASGPYIVGLVRCFNELFQKIWEIKIVLQLIFP